MKSRNKLIAIILTIIGCVAITSVGYSLYQINGSTNQSITIPVNKIETKVSSLYKFKRINPSKQIKYDTNQEIITDDIMDIELTYLGSKIRNEFDYYKNSGLLLTFNIQDYSLYDHLKNHICFFQDFLIIKFLKGNHICDSNKAYKYLDNGLQKDCFTYDDVNKKIYIHIPTDSTREVIKNNFSIRSINGEYADLTLTLSLNFHLVDEKITDKFTLKNFKNGQNSLFNIDISMEMYK